MNNKQYCFVDTLGLPIAQYTIDYASLILNTAYNSIYHLRCYDEYHTNKSRY